jgi:hypothetical protein
MAKEEIEKAGRPIGASIRLVGCASLLKTMAAV